ncbi:MAG: glycosyltransferase 87 family protein [bacterium]|nr:glycosyltransferase 87 family protein [bacterium]
MPSLLSRSPQLRMFLVAIVAVGIVGAAFHALGFFGAPINLVYSDVLGFYERASAPGFAYVSKPIEYPVLTGLFIEDAARLGGSRAGYYVVSMLALLGFAIGTTYLLYKVALRPASPELQRGEQAQGITVSRLWRYWIFAPSMFLFATYNWDLMAVFFSVAAFYLASRDRRGLAAIFLALGFCAKFYPVLYFIPLLLLATTWREWVKLCAIFGATALVVNLPFMLLNFDGWSYFFTLNSARNSNPDSIWTILRFFFSDAAVGVPAINAISLGLFAAGYFGMLWRFRRSPFLYLCFVATLLFLITNKIFSPQYILWLLPFFVLLPSVKNWQFYGLELSNIAVFFSILPWFFLGKDMFYFYLASPFVILRHVVLTMLFVGVMKKLNNGLRAG